MGIGLFYFAGMKPATAAGRALMYVAGAYNFGAALALVVLARLAPGILGVDVPSASQLLYVDLSALLVATFGFAYLLAGADLARFWPFVAMGVVGKAGVSLLGVYYFLTGNTGPLVLLLVIGDAVFAVYFLRLLHSHAVHRSEGKPS